MAGPSAGIATPSTPTQHPGTDCCCRIGDVRQRRPDIPHMRDLQRAATDVVVIGSGAVGAALTYALARNSIRVPLSISMCAVRE